MNDIVKSLSAKVPPEWIRTEHRGERELSYVPIDKVIRILNEKFEDRWDINIVSTELLPATPGAIVQVSLAITSKDGKSTTIRDGIGGDIHRGKDTNKAPDVDKLVKTAYAQAVKKAANMFGFAAELWDDDNTNMNFESGNDQTSGTGKTADTKNEQSIKETGASDKPPETKASLSEKSKSKISVFLSESKLLRSELTEYLKKYNPEATGPLFLAIGDEDKNVDNFIARVKEDLLKQA